MAFLIKQLTYKNTDKQIKKLSEISQDIPDNKLIEYRFVIKIDVFEIAGQKIAI